MDVIKKFIALDTETAGISVAEIEEKPLLSMSGVCAEWNITQNTFKLVDAFDFFFKTEYEVPADAAAVNHLSRALVNKLSGNKFFEDRFEEFKKYIYAPDTYCVGHNIPFDIEFIRQTCVMTLPGDFKPKYRGYVDTLPLTKKMAPEISSARGMKLGQAFEILCKERNNIQSEDIVESLKPFGFDITPTAHSSLYDSCMSLMLMWVYLRDNPENFDMIVKETV